MAKIDTVRAKAGQTEFPTPIKIGNATATVNGGAATIASQNAQRITLTTPTAQNDVVAITYEPADQTGNGRSETFAPTTGQTIAPTASCGLAVIQPAGTLAALTVTFPPNPAENQQFRINSTQIITALSFTGGTVVGAPTTLAANASASFAFSAVTGKWYRV